MPTSIPQFSIVALCLSSAFFFSPGLRAQELPNLPALTLEDLGVKDTPRADGAPAEILYRAVETDNTKGIEVHSIRLKVFSEQGRKFANVEIPYLGKDNQVDSIRARSIDPQGKVSEFADTIFDREIIKAKKYRFSAKAFLIPNVQPGTIIEYSYRLLFKDKVPDVFKHPLSYDLRESAYTFPAAAWTVQDDLYTRRAHFLLHAAGPYVYTHTVGLPKVDLIPLGESRYQLDVENVPPFEEEEFSPPEGLLRSRVDVFYGAGYQGPSAYWVDFGRRRSKDYQDFLKKSGAIEREMAHLISPSDSAEQKLKKLYDRAQQIRAVSFEPEKTEKEMKRERLADNKYVDDVLTRGYAFGNQINLFYVALLRLAGFDATPFLLTSRRSSLFLTDWPNEYQFNSMVVQVRLGNGSVFLDPATKYCPYGLLPWEESDAPGLAISASVSRFGATPLFKSSDALTTRTAQLRLTDEGELLGKVQLEFSGQEALNLRLEAKEQDEADRRKTIEDDLKSILPPSAKLNLLSMDGWQTAAGSLTASFDVDIPDFASRAGRRTVLPISVFHANSTSQFPSSKRLHPISFNYPQENHEEVTIDLPPGMSVEATPAPLAADQKAMFYEISAKSSGNQLKINRTLRFSSYLFDKDQYPILRTFFGRVLASDTQQITLVPRAVDP